MFKRLIKNKKAQQTAEYALLISLVVAAVIAMQTYAQRALQGRIRDAALFMATNTSSAMGLDMTTNQYEPYYLDSDYTVSRTEATTERMRVSDDGDGAGPETRMLSNRVRAKDGYQTSSAPGTNW